MATTAPPTAGIIAHAQEDGTGSVTINGDESTVKCADIDAARDALLEVIAIEAKKVDHSLRVECRDPEDTWFVVVHPNGDVENEQPQAASSRPHPAAAAVRAPKKASAKQRWVTIGILAALFVVLLGGVGVALGLTSSTDTPPAADPASAPVVADGDAQPPAEDPAAITTAPDMTARAWQGAALPISAEHGPYNFIDTRSQGFSQTPIGAALAAVHISSHISPYTGPAVFQPTASEQVVGDTTLLQERLVVVYNKAAKNEDLEGGEPSIRPTGEMVSWRLATPFTTTGDNQVEIYVRAPSSDDQVFTIPVIWSGQDWQIDPARSDGGLDLKVTAPDPTVEYTPFFPTN